MEDFTFPATAAAPPPRFIDSPPLWRPSSPRPAKTQNTKVADDEKIISLPAAFEASRKMNERDDEDEEEEKMDMLWEDLNEEFAGKEANSSPGREAAAPAQISCVRALKLSRTNGGVIKPNILVFIEVLKKVFFMHSSRRRAMRKRSW